MSHPALPPVPPSPAEPDDLDRLLSGYFKRQMPAQWPACPAPLAEPARQRSGLWVGTSNRSRLTLAASVAALLGLGLTVSPGTRPQPGSGPEDASPSGLGPSKAQDKELYLRMMKQAADQNATPPANR